MVMAPRLYEACSCIKGLHVAFLTRSVMLWHLVDLSGILHKSLIIAEAANSEHIDCIQMTTACHPEWYPDSTRPLSIDGPQSHTSFPNLEPPLSPTDLGQGRTGRAPNTSDVLHHNKDVM